MRAAQVLHRVVSVVIVCGAWLLCVPVIVVMVALLWLCVDAKRAKPLAQHLVEDKRYERFKTNGASSVDGMMHPDMVRLDVRSRCVTAVVPMAMPSSIGSVVDDISNSVMRTLFPWWPRL